MKKQMAKSFKQLIRSASAVLACVLLFSMMSVTAFAAGTETITIQKDSSIKTNWTGMTATAYQVLVEATSSTSHGTNKLYTVNEDFRAFFDMDTNAVGGVDDAFDGDGTGSVYLTYEGNKLVASDTEPTGKVFIEITNDKALDKTYPEADLVSRITTESTEAATLYTWLEKYIETNKGSFSHQDSPLPSGSAADADGNITVTGLNAGYYALIFSNVPDGISVKQGILVLAGDTMTVKAEELPLTKEVKNGSGTYGENATADMGDTLDYQITSKVPTLTDYTNLTKFEMTDTLTNQKIEDVSKFTLEIEGAQVTRENNTFKIGTETVATLSLGTYDATSNKTQTFTLTFVPDVLADYQGAAITLTYQATLTADAVQVNGNTVTLNYTNNDDVSSLTDDTEVYTYGIEVTKTFSDDKTAEHINDVTFNLYTDAAYNNGNLTGAPLTVYGATNGTYKVANEVTTPVAGTTDLKFTAAGKLTITGLDVGTYWLVETETPDGFNKADPIKIVLTAQASPNEEQLDGTATTAQYNGTGDNLATIKAADTTSINLAAFTVLNQKGFTLPQTGGAGTWMFTLGGTALIVAAGALLLISRKKKCK